MKTKKIRDEAKQGDVIYHPVCFTCTIELFQETRSRRKEENSTIPRNYENKHLQV